MDNITTPDDARAAGGDQELLDALAEPARPIDSRFLFVDVSALRAKQLRRGARARFDAEHVSPAPHKPERVAMEEVRRGLVPYALPEPRPARAEGEA
jgi:DNA-directed RNA polymerase omega subunit